MPLDALRKLTALAVIAILLCASLLLRRAPSPAVTLPATLSATLSAPPTASASSVTLWRGPIAKRTPASVSVPPVISRGRPALQAPAAVIQDADAPASVAVVNTLPAAEPAPEVAPAFLAGRALQVTPWLAAPAVDGWVPAQASPPYSRSAATRTFQIAGRSVALGVALAVRRTGGAIRAVF